MDQVGAVLQALQAIRDRLDLGGQAAWLLGHEGNRVMQLLTAFLFSTVDPAHPDRPFVAVEVIRRYEPLVQLAADAGLTAILTWGFYKVMIVRANAFQTPLGLRQMLPRACLAALAINFALPLIQAAVDFCNAICQSIELATRFTAVDLLFSNLGAELATPGLKEAVAVLLLASYVLLAFSYIVRFTLLVILAVLAPVAALLTVIPDTQHWANHWASLFVGTLFAQPLQLLLLALGAGLDAYGDWPVNHIFALASVYICFKIPGALHSSSTVGGRAAGMAKRHGRRLIRVVTKA
jgi:hypothetical protein